MRNPNVLKKVDFVLNMGTNSKYRGLTGKVIETDYVVIVEYEGYQALGRHPAEILTKVDSSYFQEELFNV